MPIHSDHPINLGWDFIRNPFQNRSNAGDLRAPLDRQLGIARLEQNLA